MPLRASENLRFQVKKVKIIEKSCIVRHQEDAKPDLYRDGAPDNVKSEDPAKMTYSIPDFFLHFPEISRFFEGLGLEMVSRNLTLRQRKSGPWPSYALTSRPKVTAAA